MLAEKQVLSLEELEAQTAIDLPDRELMQNQSGLVNIGNVSVGIGVAAAVCGVQASVLSALVAQGQHVSCIPGAGPGGVSAGPR